MLMILCRLIDEKGDIIDYDNYQAEIFIRGPLLMQGYLGNPDASTAAFDVDGWLRTGDVAYKDQGKIYVVDRKKVTTAAAHPNPRGPNSLTSTGDD